ncbi:MAG: translation initiation factor IF-3 [Candidatus Nomurabacteria bacterium]|nr:MAG: translation initiation factor IF-3 [Candidatus Nomurabacteria bacterium]
MPDVGTAKISSSQGTSQLKLDYYSLSQIFLSKPYTNYNKNRTRINQAIRAEELRVVGPEGENLGVLSVPEALKEAESRNLDLIEISPNATPPVAKIMDFGKYRYQTGRKAREVKAKSHVTETKSVQVKIGTGEHDQQLKAKRVAEWLEEGHRVKIDLFLWGRYKYMEENFLKERLDRFLKIIPAEYKVADEIKKSPKGFTITLERMAGQKGGNSKPVLKADTKKEVTNKEKIVGKSKKKSLDDLLEGGMI